MNNEELAEAIGLRIKAIRRYRLLHQEELAEDCGMSRGYICDIETGKNLPSMVALQKIAQKLNCELIVNLQLKDL